MDSNLSKWFQLLARVNSNIDPQRLVEHAYQKSSVPVYPAREKVFAALELTAPEDVKVVILGQDPYHTPGQAQGLAFSLLDGGKSQPSVRNILKELEDDLGEARVSQDFTSWAKQGVLLLNTALTVEEGKPGSMMKLWAPFTEALIQGVSDLPQPIVFVLWGNHAQGYSQLIGDKKHILSSPHPSPFSARKGFFGSKPFSKANAFLEENGLKSIDWIG